MRDTDLNQLIRWDAQKVHHRGQLDHVVEDHTLEALLAGPALQEVQVDSEALPAVVVEHSQLSPIQHQVIEHGHIDEEKQIGIQLENHL